MFYIIPTDKGLGVQIWGNYSDLFTLHSFLEKYAFFSEEISSEKKTQKFISRRKIIREISFLMKESYSGNKLTRHYNHITFENEKLYGFNLTWITIHFFLISLKLNFPLREPTKLESSFLLQIEYWFHHSLSIHDIQTYKKMDPFFNYNIHVENNYLYQYMIYINYCFINLKKKQKRTRRLPSLLGISIPNTKDYNDYLSFLKNESLKQNCKIEDIEPPFSNTILNKDDW